MEYCDKSVLWGFHLSMDCKGGNDNIKDKDAIANFCDELVVAIDMKAYGEPQIVLFGSGNKEGYTLVQLIETSNICCHFCSESGNFYLDVFSCKPFDTLTVRNVVRKYFDPIANKERFIERGI